MLTLELRKAFAEMEREIKGDIGPLSKEGSRKEQEGREACG